MTPAQLQAATGCTEEGALLFAQPLTAACERWGVEHLPEFLAQVAVESGGLRRLQEGLTYITQQRLVDVYGRRYFPTLESARPFVRNPEGLANYVYDDANRKNKLGNTQPGDGWKYRGRGLKQLTGRDNYARYQAASGVLCVDAPDLLLDPAIAADSAAWFWHANGCDALAGDVTALTRRINGGLNGLAQRVALTATARGVFA